MRRASEVTRISFCLPVSASTSVMSAINESGSPKVGFSSFIFMIFIFTDCVHLSAQYDVPQINIDDVEHGQSIKPGDTTGRFCDRVGDKPV